MKIKELGIWAAVIVILTAGSWFLINAVNNSPSPSAPIKISNLPPLSKEDFVKGDEKAEVALIEYADFQCPACASYFPLLKMLSSEFSKDLKIVYRFFPLTAIHKNAMFAAQAAYAAGLQGQDKFWEMHDTLYENQNSWANTSPKDIFIGYAKDLELDLEKFKEDLNSSKTKNFINSETNKAVSIGINSTPTFMVNGKRIQNPPNYESFKKIIQDEIEAR